MSENRSYEFVDTNIFLYAYDLSDAGKRQKAQALISHLWETGRGCISIQVLQELYVNLTLKIPRPLTPQVATQIISDLGQWRLHIPELSSLIEAVNIQQRHQVSFWEAMIICSAKELDCITLWTEDLNPGQRYEGIDVVNPLL